MAATTVGQLQLGEAGFITPSHLRRVGIGSLVIPRNAAVTAAPPSRHSLAVRRTGTGLVLTGRHRAHVLPVTAAAPGEPVEPVAEVRSRGLRGGRRLWPVVPDRPGLLGRLAGGTYIAPEGTPVAFVEEGMRAAIDAEAVYRRADGGLVVDVRARAHPIESIDSPSRWIPWLERDAAGWTLRVPATYALPQRPVPPGAEVVDLAAVVVPGVRHPRVLWSAPLQSGGLL